MDNLEKLIEALSEKEQRAFRSELTKTVRSKEVIKLYDALVAGREWKPGELRSHLYSKASADKYYNTRRRLGEFVKRYIHANFQEDHEAPEGRIQGMMAVARVMLKRRNYAAAGDQLTEIRQMAEALHLYDVLANIYTLQLAHAEHLGVEVDETMSMATANLDKLSLVNKLNLAFVNIRRRLATYRRLGQLFDTERTMREALMEVKFQRRELLYNPVFVLRLMELARTVVVSGKDYARFKPYLVRAYQLLSHRQAFRGPNASLEGDFLYMLAHVHYRTREFEEALRWLNKLQCYLQSARFLENMQANALMLRAGISFYNGDATGAIATLQSGIDGMSKGLGTREKWNMHLNLAVYTFFTADYRRSVRLMNTIPARAKALEADLGMEWYFKRDMIDVIFQYENKNIDGALSLLTSMRRYYSVMLEEPNYKQARTFIDLVHYFFNYPEHVNSREFLERVQVERAGLRDQPEDLQAIVFYSWLRSKMTRRDMYEVLIERVNQKASG
jgi:hypothetical protein